MPPKRFALLIAVFAATLATAGAYVLEGPKWPAGTTMVLQLSLGSPNAPLQDGSTSWNQAIVPAIEMWNANIRQLHITSVMNSAARVGRGDGGNSIAFSNSVFGQSFGGNTLGVTVYQYSGGSMFESDTLFNNAIKFDSYRGPLQFPGPGLPIVDIRRVFLHELGHGIGLGHPDGAGQHVNAVMNSVVSDQSSLTDDDISGAQQMYGAPAAQPDPTPTPKPTPAPTPRATPTPAPVNSGDGKLANISTRMRVGRNDNVLIGGFIIKGSQPKKVIVRALGPSMTDLPGVLRDPFLDLHDAAGNGVASNDDWQSGNQVKELVASGIAPTHRNEPAMIVTLAPGSYTAIVTGYGQSSGLALIEVYDCDSSGSRLANISTRGFVGTNNEVLIGGLIVDGGSKNVIVRATGPSMSKVLPNTLADPTLDLHDSSGNLVATNDNFGDSPRYAQIVASGLAPGDSRESAIQVKLPPGNYTAIVRGADDATGIGMVEVFDIDP